MSLMPGKARCSNQICWFRCPMPVKTKVPQERIRQSPNCKSQEKHARTSTLPETNMETKKRDLKDYSPFKRDYMGFRVSLGECRFRIVS